MPASTSGRPAAADPDDAAARTTPGSHLLTTVLAVVLLALAVAVRVPLLDHESPDLRIYLTKWWGHFASKGFAGLADTDADYAPPYLYLLYLGTLTGVEPRTGIKAISMLGDTGLLTAAVVLLRRFASLPWALAGGAALLLVPSVVLDSASWGQCDAIYTALLVAAVWGVVARRDLLAWLLFAAAVAVKLQAVFLAPLLVVVWVLRLRRTWWMPVLVPVVVLVSWVPSMLAGRSLGSLAHVYLGQASQGFPLSYAPNLWYLLPRARTPVEAAHLADVALVVAAAVIALLVVAALVRRRHLTGGRLVALAAAFLVLAPAVLPHMRERYFYPGLVLTVLAAVVAGRRRWWVALLFAAASGLTFVDQLYHPWLAPRLRADTLVLEIPVVLVALGVLVHDGLRLDGARRAERADLA